MKKGSGSNQTASNRESGGTMHGGSHRQTASASVGTSLKQRGSAAVTSSETNTNTERTSYHQSGAAGGGQISKPNPFNKQSSTASGKLNTP